MKNIDENTKKVGAIFKSNRCGFYKIVQYINSKNIIVEFIETGYRTKTYTSCIYKGLVRDNLFKSVQGLGFMGDGPYNSSNTKLDNGYDIYSVWLSIMKRCYDKEYQEKYTPSYKGCNVDPIWHCFQNFAEWCLLMYPNDGKRYTIDKDILISGNRTYGPDFCKFVTNQENTEKASAKVYNFIDPSGNKVEIYNIGKFCRGTELRKSGFYDLSAKRTQQYKGWTLPKDDDE